MSAEYAEKKNKLQSHKDRLGNADNEPPVAIQMIVPTPGAQQTPAMSAFHPLASG